MSRALASRKLFKPNVFRGATAAYSVRVPTYSTYAGPLLRVRRSGDDAELDIFATEDDDFGNKFIDTAALLIFVEDNSAFVTTWYDQSGYHRDIIQSNPALQPRIVNSGVIELSNSKPAVFTVSTMTMSVVPAPWLITGNADRTLNTIMNRHNGAGMFTWSGDHSFNKAWGVDMSAFGTYCPYTYGDGDIFNGAIVTPYDSAAIGTAVRVSGVSTGYINGTINGTNIQPIVTTSDFGLGIGARPDGASCEGWYSEIVYFDKALNNTAREALELSQSNAFGITLS